MKPALFCFAIVTSLSFLLGGSPALAEDHQGHFRHVVCFQFKEGTTDAEIEKIATAFADLESKIDTIIDFEWGPSENIEPLNDGFTHCFVVTFKDKKGLEVYLPHEAHTEFVSLLKPRLEKVFVFDYTAQ